jgi:hypothetical protein
MEVGGGGGGVWCGAGSKWNSRLNALGLMGTACQCLSHVPPIIWLTTDI